MNRWIISSGSFLSAESACCKTRKNGPTRARNLLGYILAESLCKATQGRNLLGIIVGENYALMSLRIHYAPQLNQIVEKAPYTLRSKRTWQEKHDTGKSYFVTKSDARRSPP